MKISLRRVRYSFIRKEKVDNGGIKEVGYYYSETGSKVMEVTERSRGILVESLSYDDKNSFGVFKAICLTFFDKFSQPNQIVRQKNDGKTYYTMMYGRENLISREVEKLKKSSEEAEVINPPAFYKDVLMR